MRTERIQGLIFESKVPRKRFLNEGMQASLESLLIRMNHSTEIENKGDSYIATIMTKLKHNENCATFEDERRLDKILPHNKQRKGFSVLKFGRTRLDIDNTNGEIIDYKKPFLKPWFMVLKKAERVLYELRSDFLEPLVTKETIRLHKLTPEGIKKMKQFVLQTEKNRLQQITRDLEMELSNENL